MAELVPINVLRAEYEESSEAFIKQIDFLSSQGYEGIRRSRGDGDCFYRCVCFEDLTSPLRGKKALTGHEKHSPHLCVHRAHIQRTGFAARSCDVHLDA